MASQGANVGVDALQQPSRPYLPTTWALGGLNKQSVDVPITCVLLGCYIISAATHMAILKKNNKRGHKFLFSGALFGFSMSRIITCILRISSVCLPRNASLAIAAAVFTAAGVVIIYVVNILWTVRIVRSIHPNFGWHPAISVAMKVFFVVLGLTLATLITATVQSFMTLDQHIRHIDRSLQLYGQTFMGVVSSAPIVILAFAFAFPRRSTPERFGAGRLRTKVFIVLTGSFLLALGAWYRFGTSWQTPIPRSLPMPAYLHKAAFYCFNFLTEILVSFFYAIIRVDLRFWIPNGARGPGSYRTTSDVAQMGVVPEKDELEPDTLKAREYEKV